MIIPNKFNGYAPDGGRQYHKKGGSSGAAERMEQERQSRINAAVSAINNIFAGAGRDNLYNQHKDAVYNINVKDVADQYSDAERANRFGLARHGLMGGSADIDSQARLQEKANEGYVKAAGLADSAVSDFMAADERSKQSLLSMAQSGIDTGTAQQMALNNLNANAQSAAGSSAGASIGGLFNNLGQAYLTRQIMDSANRGWNGYYSTPSGNLNTDTRVQGSIT